MEDNVSTVGDTVRHTHTKEIGLVVEIDECADGEPIRWVKVIECVRCFPENQLRKVHDEAS